MTSQSTHRDIVVAFRLTAMEATHVDAAGKALRQPRARADFCRSAALYAAGQKVPAPTKAVRLPARRLPALDTQLLGKLLAESGRVGAVVNELMRASDASGALPTATILASIAADIATIRDGVMTALRGNSNTEGGSGDHQG